METTLTRENVLDYLKSRIKDDSPIVKEGVVVFVGNESFEASPIGKCDKGDFIKMLRILHAEDSIFLNQPYAELQDDGSLPGIGVALH